MFESLTDVQVDCSNRLVRAAKDRKSAMHTPVVVTADADARIMVLRKFDQTNGTLRFHTDIRSPKADVIAQDQRMAVLFYDRDAKVQIRARGAGWIEHDSDIAEQAWLNSTNFARRCYLGDGPGMASDAPTSGLPLEFEGVEPTDQELIPARRNFAVLLVKPSSLDWLYLAHTGHLRAQFDRDENEEWQGRWVSP